MNKEITPLEVAKQLKDFVLEFVKNGLDRRFVIGSFDIIEQSLQSLERYDAEHLGIREAELNDVKAMCKAFNIIKEKRVDVSWLVISDDLKEYNEGLERKWKLTQEEYDLLKEVLL